MSSEDLWRKHLDPKETAELARAEVPGVIALVVGALALPLSIVAFFVSGQVEGSSSVSAWLCVGNVLLAVGLLLTPIGGVLCSQAEPVKKRLRKIAMPRVLRVQFQAQRERRAEEEEESHRENEALRRQEDAEAERWRSRAARFADSVRGSRMGTRYDWARKIGPVLLDIGHEQSVEALVVVLLSDENVVLDAQLTLGNEYSVTFSPRDIVARCLSIGATKIILGHNHPEGHSTTPSDADVESAAQTYFEALTSGIALVDDLVVCVTSSGREIKSVMATQRFRGMIREY